MSRSDRANPNAKNFGLRNADMARAGANALKEGMQSYSSIQTMSDRWQVFAHYAKQDLGLRDMRRITVEHLHQYAAHLSGRFERGELSAAAAQNYLSTVNRVMEIARGDRQVRADPVRQANLPRRSGVCIENKAISLARHHQIQNSISPRIAAIVELQRQFGLRFE